MLDGPPLLLVSIPVLCFDKRAELGVGHRVFGNREGLHLVHILDPFEFDLASRDLDPQDVGYTIWTEADTLPWIPKRRQILTDFHTLGVGTRSVLKALDKLVLWCGIEAYGLIDTLCMVRIVENPL